MKPDRLAEIEAQYKAGYYTDASIIAQLIEAAHELRTELTTARQTIVDLLGENRALRAEVRKSFPGRDRGQDE